VDDLVATAGTLLERHDPTTALRAWFDRVAEYAPIKRGVFAALEVATWEDLSARSLGPIGDAITLLLDAGRAAGEIRPDVDARDVVILIGYLSRLDAAEFDARRGTCSKSFSTACAAAPDDRPQDADSTSTTNRSAPAGCPPLGLSPYARPAGMSS
jgi:hypothetical protein